jgi:23S rRNA (adenine2503-C2)-methyltransferase
MIMTTSKEPLFGKTLPQIQELVSRHAMPKYTAIQIAEWLYQKNASSFQDMSNISKQNRQLLDNEYTIGLSDPQKVQVSTDGTRKYLFSTRLGKYIEAAYIPEKTRNTLCISSQVGCKMGCLFCMTGKQGFQGNLSAGEILNQIQRLPERDKLTNIVYMGMGEPMDNLAAVMESLDVLTSSWGYGMSPKRITVSTIGIIPAMKTFLEKSPCHLAISLHTPFDEERQKLMPIENVYPLKEIIGILKAYAMGPQRRVSFEYIMFDGLNDTPRHIRELVRILHGIKCRVNLIRFHPIPGTPLKGTADQKIEEFRNALKAKGIMATIRASRGEDILAACGLLSTKEHKPYTI